MSKQNYHRKGLNYHRKGFTCAKDRATLREIAEYKKDGKWWYIHECPRCGLIAKVKGVEPR